MDLKNIFVLAVLLISSSVGATMIWYPVVTDLRITRCQDNPNGVPCSYGVFYRVYTDRLQVPVQAPFPRNGNIIRMYGIHCDKGSSALGVPFEGCVWSPSHSVPGATCDATNSWETFDVLHCGGMWAGEWGPHTGAGAGGECNVWGISVVESTLHTPWGDLDATAAANAGSSVCVKSPPPTETCEMDPIPDMAFGRMRPDETKEMVVSAPINCGPSPRVDISGPTNIEIVHGLTLKLDTTRSTPTRATVTGVMSGNNAAKGAHSYSVVVVVSPQ